MIHYVVLEMNKLNVHINKMDLSNVYISIGFTLSFFSAMITTGLAVGAPRKIKYVEKPSSPLPDEIKKLIIEPAKIVIGTSKITTKQTVGPIPWQSTKSRTTFKCRTVDCSQSKKIYDIELPRLLDPNAPSGAPWSTLINAWHLGHALFSTSYDSDYPWATVLEIPANTPQNVKFLIDQGYNNGGLRPSINANDSLFFPNGINITGDYPNSFVIINNASHELYFSKLALDNDEDEPLQYWSIRPNSKLLMWPANTYWQSINNNIKRYWNASVLPNDISVDFAAFLAETIMFDYLAPKSPSVQT